MFDKLTHVLLTPVTLAILSSELGETFDVMGSEVSSYPTTRTHLKCSTERHHLVTKTPGSLSVVILLNISNDGSITIGAGTQKDYDAQGGLPFKRKFNITDKDTIMAFREPIRDLIAEVRKFAATPVMGVTFYIPAMLGVLWSLGGNTEDAIIAACHKAGAYAKRVGSSSCRPEGEVYTRTTEITLVVCEKGKEVVLRTLGDMAYDAGRNIRSLADKDTPAPRIVTRSA